MNERAVPAPTTFADAVAVLRNASLGVPRWFALRAGYEMQDRPDVGIGWFPVEIATDDTCDCKLSMWTKEGDLLVCPTCFMDGT